MNDATTQPQSFSDQGMSSADAAMQGREALSAAVASARDRAQTQQGEIERLRSELAGCRGELETARVRAEETGKLEAEIENLNRQLGESKKKITQMDTEANERSKALREQRTQLKKLNEACQLMQSENKKMRNEFTRIMQQKGLGGSLRSMFGG